MGGRQAGMQVGRQAGRWTACILAIQKSAPPTHPAAFLIKMLEDLLPVWRRWRIVIEKVTYEWWLFCPTYKSELGSLVDRIHIIRLTDDSDDADDDERERCPATKREEEEGATSESSSQQFWQHG